MIIYRFEHPETGKGPYVTLYGYKSKELTDALYLHQDREHHPSPRQEDIPLNGRFCAFRDLEQMEDWFTIEEQELMYASGFELLELGVPEEFIDFGCRQVVYAGTESTVVSITTEVLA